MRSPGIAGFIPRRSPGIAGLICINRSLGTARFIQRSPDIAGFVQRRLGKAGLIQRSPGIVGFIQRKKTR